MDVNKSLDESEIIAALLTDVSTSYGEVFNTRACRLTINKVRKRTRQEGLGFLTKTLPKLGKAFDKALTGDTRLNAIDHGFKPMKDSQLPRFLGELFSKVLQPTGECLPNPCERCVAIIRNVLMLFYKYELDYADEQEQQVVSQFERTEEDLQPVCEMLQEIEASLTDCYHIRRSVFCKTPTTLQVAREAKILLSKVFSSFDPHNILPRHGPGAVSTKEKLWHKYLWKNVSGRITKQYPLDEFFFSSLGHVCDRFDSLQAITDRDLPARVILVPKDSRGPRLISCEPVDFQWIQQGIGRAMVELVEGHYLTKDSVRFTDQTPNQNVALLASRDGRYATLDLKEASDRVSTDLVRLLFPSHVFTCLEAARSSSTELPSGKILPLRKFAPMGSCLCFPVMALTIWAILAGGAPDAYTRNRIYVYGDDVIVPTAYAADAIKHLESFGLLVNRDKSCTSGFFRESCGMDAFKGVPVTPVRIRTVWSSTPRPDVYSSWTAYANSFYDKRYYRTYEYIVGHIHRIYGEVPSTDMGLPCPSLRDVSERWLPKRRRWNSSLQKVEYYVRDVRTPDIKHKIDGWSMLLRYFTEFANSRNKTRYPKDLISAHQSTPELGHLDPAPKFSVDRYTSRRASMLVRRWR